MADIIWVAQDAPNDGNGSLSDPFQRIQSAIDAAQPGTIIQVKAGVYTENLDFAAGGAAGAPIVLVSVDGLGAAVIKPARADDDTIQIDGHDYITIDGFQLHGSADDSRQVIHIHAVDGNTNPATNIHILNNYIKRGEGDGIKISKSSDIIVQNNTVEGGGPEESGIDIVGGERIILDANLMFDVPNIGFMIKGGSRDIAVTNNTILNTGKNAIEVGGYTNLDLYPPGFLSSDNQFEASNVLLQNNSISGSGNWDIRMIGAQSVTAFDNTFDGEGRHVRIDDSDKFHDPWYSDKIGFNANEFGTEDWLRDRSENAEIINGPAALNLFQWWENILTPDPEPQPAPTPEPEPTLQPEPTPQPEPVPAPQPEPAPAPEPEATPDPLPEPTPAPQPEPDPVPVIEPDPTLPTEPDGTVYTVVEGTAERDKIWGTAQDEAIFGFSDDDVLSGGSGNDHIDGGDGRDKLSGGSGDDVLFGGSEKDELRGDSGDDFLSGMGGEDKLQGDKGNDTLDGGSEDDRLEGGNGNDLLDGGDGDDELRGGNQMDTLLGGSGNDEIEGEKDDDLLYGSDGDDRLDGGDGDDYLDGGADDDELQGGDGNDVLDGDTGEDTLDGENGNDTLEGGYGNDTLKGGDGDDTFLFRADLGFGVDLIEDFETDLDYLMLIDFEQFRSFSDLDSNGDGILNDADLLVTLSGNNMEIDFSDQYSTVEPEHIIQLEADYLTAEHFIFLF